MEIPLEGVEFRIKKSYRVWLVLSYASLFVFGLTDNLRGIIFPEILNDFKVNNSEGSLFFALASLSAIFGAAIAPQVITLLGFIGTLSFFMVGLLVAQVGFYWSPTFPILLSICIVFGISIGGLGVVQNLLVLVSVPEKKRQKAQSGLHACYGASSLLAPMIVLLISIMGFNWRSSFLTSAGLIIMFLVLVLLFGGMGKASDRHSAPVQRRKYPRIEGSYIALILAVYVAVEVLIATRLALFMRVEKGLDLQGSSRWVSLFFTGLFLGRLVLTFYTPQISIRWQLYASLFSTVFFIALGIWVAPEWMVLTGFTMAPFYPLTMAALSLMFHENVDKVAAASVALSGVTVVIMHSTVGLITDAWGLRAAYMLALLLSGLTLAMMMFYKKLFQRSIP